MKIELDLSPAEFAELERAVKLAIEEPTYNQGKPENHVTHMLEHKVSAAALQAMTQRK